MIPKSFSASAALVYENCPSRYVAENIKKTPQPSSDHADLGTACHTALEKFVVGKFHLKHADHYDTLVSLFTEAYEELFSDDSRYAEGVKMMHDWWERQDWTGRTVLSTELKENFPIRATVDGISYEVPFNYIWDRCDDLERPDGQRWVEVVDYKTLSRPIPAAELKNKIQARCYGLAAQVKYPDVERVWVTFDLLRYEPVGTVFTREENIATYRYLQRLFRRIITTKEEEAAEKLNPDCRWCVRKQVCKTLQEHITVGGVLGLTDPATAAERRYMFENQKKAIEAAIGELDTFLLDWFESEDALEFATDDLTVSVTARKTRALDPGRAKDIIGPDLLAEYGTLGVTAVDKLLKDPRLTDAQKEQLRGLIRQKYSEPKIQVTPKNPIDP